MFLTLSQVAALFLTPTNALVILILLGLLIGLIKPAAARAHRLVAVAAMALCLLAILPFGDWLLRPLETRFPPFTPDGAPVAGIVVLGGSVSAGATPRGPHTQPNRSADRLFETARLARLFPKAAVVVSGGPENPATHVSEADIVAGYLMALGVSPARLIRERQSKDTFENARFSSAMVHPRPGQRWLLVTSAAHMPRAMACFRAAGFIVQAAPADWRRGPRGTWRVGWSASGNLGAADLASKEYLGLIVYRLEGRTSELFPGP